MAKFKVGDKVRVASIDADGPSIYTKYLRKVGHVVELYGGYSAYPVVVRFGDKSGKASFKDDELELLTSPAEFSAEAQSVIDQLQHDVKVLLDDRESLRGDLRRIAGTLSKDDSVVSPNGATVRAAVQELRDSCSYHKANAKGWQNEYDKLKRKLAELDTDASATAVSAISKMNAAVRERDELKADCEKLKSSYEKLKSEYATVNDQLKYAKSEARDWKADAEKWRDELDELRKPKPIFQPGDKVLVDGTKRATICETPPHTIFAPASGAEYVQYAPGQGVYTDTPIWLLRDRLTKLDENEQFLLDTNAAVVLPAIKAKLDEFDKKAAREKTFSLHPVDGGPGTYIDLSNKAHAAARARYYTEVINAIRGIIDNRGGSK